jgi:hypothetical protein
VAFPPLKMGGHTLQDRAELPSAYHHVYCWEPEGKLHVSLTYFGLKIEGDVLLFATVDNLVKIAMLEYGSSVEVNI